MALPSVRSVHRLAQAAVVSVIVALASAAVSPTPAVAAPDPIDGTVVAVGSMESGQLDLFAVGSDGALRHRPYANGRWHGWEDLGGALNSAPAVASWAPGRLDVFARGVDNDIRHRWYENGQWGPWGSLGGTFTSAPAAVSWGPGRLDVFARGTDNAIWTASFEGYWRNWGSLGGTLTSAPTAASWGPGRLDVFARGVDNAIWSANFEGHWRGWHSLGGAAASAPAAASWGPGRLDVFTLDDHKNVVQKTFDGHWRDWGRASGLEPARVPIERSVPIAATQLQPVDGALTAPVVYSYVDDIGRLRYGYQVDPGTTGSIQWTTFASGDAFSGRPAMQQQPDGRLQIAAHQTDGDVSTITERTAASAPLGGAVDVGGWLRSNVTSGKLADGRIVLFGVDADGVLIAKQQTAPNGGYGTWRSLGGVGLADAPTVARTRVGLRLFARDTTGRLLTAVYQSGSTLSEWTDLNLAGWTGSPAVVEYPGYRTRVLVRSADGTVVTKFESDGGVWPDDWQVTGPFIAAGSPAAILDPVLGRTAVVARGTDNQIYRLWETSAGSGQWGTWGRAESAGGEPLSDQAVTDPSVVAVNSSNGATWYTVFRNINDRAVVYERELESTGAYAPMSAASAARGSATAKPGPSGFARHTLPKPPAADND